MLGSFQDHGTELKRKSLGSSSGTPTTGDLSRSPVNLKTTAVTSKTNVMEAQINKKIQYWGAWQSVQPL